MAFEIGNRFGKTGKKSDHGGDVPNWFRNECDKLIKHYSLLPRLAQIGAGKILFKKPVVVGFGKDAYVELVDVPADASVQVYAIEKLLDRAYGKPQPMQLDNKFVDSNISLIFNFFKIIDNLSKDEQLRDRLTKVIESAQVVPAGELLQNQNQKQGTDNTQVKQDPAKDI